MPGSTRSRRWSPTRRRRGDTRGCRTRTGDRLRGRGAVRARLSVQEAWCCIRTRRWQRSALPRASPHCAGTMPRPSLPRCRRPRRMVAPGPYTHAVEGALVRNVWPAAGAWCGMQAVEWAECGIGGLASSPYHVFASAFGSEPKLDQLTCRPRRRMGRRRRLSQDPCLLSVFALRRRGGAGSARRWRVTSRAGRHHAGDRRDPSPRHDARQPCARDDARGEILHAAYRGGRVHAWPCRRGGLCVHHADRQSDRRGSRSCRPAAVCAGACLAEGSSGPRDARTRRWNAPQRYVRERAWRPRSAVLHHGDPRKDRRNTGEVYPRFIGMAERLIAAEPDVLALPWGSVKLPN